jgi:hypothetical protein
LEGKGEENHIRGTVFTGCGEYGGGVNQG